MNRFQAIRALRPTASYRIEGEKLIWQDSNIEQPTEETIQSKLKELQAAEPLRLLREERDQKLAATDWRATVDYPGNDKQLWLDYRQALRDITLQDPNNVIWPEEPA